VPPLDELKPPSAEARVTVDALRRTIGRHSLTWLVVANFVGLLLASMLVWPELNDVLSPLTYGRWVPLHLNWQLYGWCALPLVGALFAYYLPEDARALASARRVLWLWSGVLLYAGITWLGGRTSGKIFLDWTGGVRLAWSITLLLLWVVLWWQNQRLIVVPFWARSFLVSLLAVPFLVYWSAGLDVYPPVNPQSGGATGASLLGSTLGVVAIFGLLPWLLRLKAVAPKHTLRRFYAVGLAVSFSLYAGISRTHASHHRLDQIVGLASLLVWIPLVWKYARAFVWAADSWRWLTAAYFWWLSLLITGFLTFLPGFSERWKFTNGLVGHSHLAMAGMVTSLHVAILLNLKRDRGTSSRVFEPPSWSYWVWQIGCGVHVAVLLWLGWAEGVDPSILYIRGGPADWCYGLRLAAGLGMAAASVSWLWRVWQDQEK